MYIIDCSDCDRLRADYRRATRSELDLTVQLDEAAMKNDIGRLQELRSLLAAVGMARDGACQSILEHEKKHISRTALYKQDNQPSAELGS